MSVTSASSPNAIGAGDQVPARMRGEERREQDRDRRGVHRVRGDHILARGLAIAHDQQRDRDDDADDHAHRRLQPSLIERVAQEEHRGEHERDAGDRREQAHADELFPVERSRRWRRRFGRLDQRRGPLRWRRRNRRRRRVAADAALPRAPAQAPAAAARHDRLRRRSDGSADNGCRWRHRWQHHDRRRLRHRRTYRSHAAARQQAAPSVPAVPQPRTRALPAAARRPSPSAGRVDSKDARSDHPVRRCGSRARRRAVVCCAPRPTK